MGPLPLIIFNLIVGACVIQAMVMGVVLFFLPAKEDSKKYLSLILFTLGVLSFKILLHTLGLWNRAVFRFFPLAIDTTLPPLLYLYIASVTAYKVSRWRVWLYFTPTIVFMSYAIVVYVLAFAVKDIGHKNILVNSLLFNYVKDVEDYLAVAFGILFWIFGFRRIRCYRKWLFGTQSDNSIQEFTWLRDLLIVSAILVFGLVIVVMAEDVFATRPHSFYPLQIFYIYLTILTYYLSLKAYALYGFYKAGNAAPLDMAISQFVDVVPEEYQLQPAIYAKDYQLIKESILNSLEHEKIYLDPELNIKQMSIHVGYPVAAVSAAINQGFGMNFRNLINQYRVRAFKELSVNPPINLSLYGLALECGFNSEASFFRIFRQETGLSPNDYLKQRQA